MAATQTVLGLTANVIIAAVMLAASSAAFALFNMTAVTMQQRQIPAELLGRVTSLSAPSRTAPRRQVPSRAAH